MTAVLERGRTAPQAVPEVKTGSRLPVSPRSRRPLKVLASLVVVLASIAAFAHIYASANRQTDVLTVTQTIQQGQQLTATDLGQASVSISGGVTPIPLSDASQLQGKRAAVTIPAGSLLTVGDITAAQPIAAGYAVVGMALKAGQLPSAGVASGDQVMIVQTASPGASLGSTPDPGSSSAEAEASTGVLVPQANVFDVEIPPASAGSSASQLVSVEVSTTLAAAVSNAAAADQVSLVLLPSGSSMAQPAVRGDASTGHQKTSRSSGRR